MVSGLKSWSFLFVVALVVAAVGGSVYASSHRQPHVYAQDTEQTLRFKVSLWGNPEVGIDTQGLYADFTRIDSLASNPPYPPYYNATDNESVVRVTNLAFGNPVGDNPVPEVPITKVRCRLVTVSGAFDGVRGYR